jgi:hypothetical protein
MMQQPSWQLAAIFLAFLSLNRALAQDAGIDPNRLPGIVVDESAAKLEGTWSPSKHTRPFVGEGYSYSQGGAGQRARFPVEINETGPYQVLVSYTPGTNRSQNAIVIVPTADGPKTFVIDQQARPAGPYCFQPLGEVMMESGQHEIIVSGEENQKGVIIADAVQILTPDGFTQYKAEFEKNSPKLLANLKPDPNKPEPKKKAKAAEKKEEELPAEIAPAFVRKSPAKPREQLTTAALDGLMERHVGGIQTAILVDDESFLRRVTLDLIGRQPTLAELAAFVADTSEAKVANIVE